MTSSLKPLSATKCTQAAPGRTPGSSFNARVRDEHLVTGTALYWP